VVNHPLLHPLKPLAASIFNIQDEVSFREETLKVFQHQAIHNELYRNYITTLKIQPETVKEYRHIPFLPIEFFKEHRILTGNAPVQEVFTSSGTSGMSTSIHHVIDVKIYEESYLKAFRLFYGAVSDYCILALLPSYLERTGSSLIYMADDLIRRSQHPDSGFYLHNYDELLQKLQELETKRQKTLLLGVTYSLLDIAEIYKARNYPKLEHTIIMETGGMKGKRKEMVREELHETLCSSFGVTSVHSEYGMTELLSQAYSKGEGLFSCPPWMRILIRDANDPFTFLSHRQTGGINVIDLANINSCSFIATQDLGKTFEDGTFEVLGRFDASDVRGCNLLVM
jgi:phenylacetate-coenzyme A ligase PaaK-like adenylate-forming protein